MENKNQTYFLQGGESFREDSTMNAIKEKISEFTNVKNIHFLLGAGTSSGAIPDMKDMKKEIKGEIKETELSDGAKQLYDDVSENNLEELLNTLYAKQHFLSGSKTSNPEELGNTSSLIDYIENKMFSKINVVLEDANAQPTLDLYKEFYQKIAIRNKDLSRVNVFTTNNDLFNEKALDNLNLNYNNGFGGGVEKVFNPARFHYTFSKKIDPNLEKFEPLENMVYLYKLHGSINWVEKEGNSLFNIQEVPVKEGDEKSESNHVLIYPTPLKQSHSLGSPYSDLIREFQTKLSQQNSVLFVIGYSFSDEHLNNIIYQALATNSSLSIFIFGQHDGCALTKIKDSRIFQVYSSGKGTEKIHYFDYIVSELLPNLDENKEVSLLDSFVDALKKESL